VEVTGELMMQYRFERKRTPAGEITFEQRTKTMFRFEPDGLVKIWEMFVKTKKQLPFFFTAVLLHRKG